MTARHLVFETLPGCRASRFNVEFTNDEPQIKHPYLFSASSFFASKLSLSFKCLVCVVKCPKTGWEPEESRILILRVLNWRLRERHLVNTYDWLGCHQGGSRQDTTEHGCTKWKVNLNTESLEDLKKDQKNKFYLSFREKVRVVKRRISRSWGPRWLHQWYGPETRENPCRFIWKSPIHGALFQGIPLKVPQCSWNSWRGLRLEIKGQFYWIS